MFLDRVKIKIKAGDGGDGVVSFYRSKLTMNGGPDGGNGGRGGDVYFVAKNDQSTLYSFQFKKKFVAGNGEKGDKNFCAGKDGKSLEIIVPCGTIIKEPDTEKVIADLNEEGKKIKILHGGNGGKGNAFFASSTRQAPHFSQTGEKTKEYEVLLELKTIADVGLVGFPNVGKSTLLATITNAKPKIADYHFTTLYPNLGVVNHYGNTFIIADIPGLIEGASQGAGLGHHFLKHIERVRLVVHMVDISEIEGRDAFEDYKTINNELKNYSEKLYNLKQIVALTKTDLIPSEEKEEKIMKFRKQIGMDIPVIPISSITGAGLDELKNTIWKILKDIPKPTALEVEKEDIDARDTTSLTITREEDGAFRIEGGRVDNMIRGIVLNDQQSFAYFQKILKQDGIFDKLKEHGAKEGDIVRIKDIEFEFVD